ncbi:MAG: hypothetical protein KDA28_12270, partial [Phycisphaerales bacterium]|nr:hypothetical protein [Phycisphaerales bacterium]
ILVPDLINILVYLTLALAPADATSFQIEEDGAVTFEATRNEDGSWTTSTQTPPLVVQIDGTTLLVTIDGVMQRVELSQDYQIAGLDLAAADTIMRNGGGRSSIFIRREDDGRITFADAMLHGWTVYGVASYGTAAQ